MKSRWRREVALQGKLLWHALEASSCPVNRGNAHVNVAALAAVDANGDRPRAGAAGPVPGRRRESVTASRLPPRSCAAGPYARTFRGSGHDCMSMGLFMRENWALPFPGESPGSAAD